MDTLTARTILNEVEARPTKASIPTHRMAAVSAMTTATNTEKVLAAIDAQFNHPQRPSSQWFPQTERDLEFLKAQFVLRGYAMNGEQGIVAHDAGKAGIQIVLGW